MADEDAGTWQVDFSWISWTFRCFLLAEPGPCNSGKNKVLGWDPLYNY